MFFWCLLKGNRTEVSPSPFLGLERSEFKATECTFIFTQQAHLIHSCPVFGLHRSRWWGQVCCGWCWLPCGLLLPLFLYQARGHPSQPPLKLDAAGWPSLCLEEMRVNNHAASAFLLLRRLPSSHFLSFPSSQETGALCWGPDKVAGTRVPEASLFVHGGQHSENSPRWRAAQLQECQVTGSEQELASARGPG